MFKRNDGLGVNATQNKFTAMLKRSIHNSKINYLKSHNKILCNEMPLEDYAYLVGEEYDYVQYGKQYWDKIDTKSSNFMFAIDMRDSIKEKFIKDGAKCRGYIHS